MTPRRPLAALRRWFGSRTEKAAGDRGAGFGRLAVALLACAGSSSCGRPAVVARAMPSAVVSRRDTTLDASLVDAVVGEREGDAYRLGPGDSLLVAVYGHPELSIAPFVSSGVGGQGGRPVGLLVDNDGSVQLPLIGRILVNERTSEEVQELLVRDLAVYIKEPSVAVQVLFAGNIRYYLLGQFTNPGLKYSDRPLGLLEALTLGGSVDLEHASLISAYVARKGKKLPVDFRRLVLDGDLRQNVRLKSGDVVVVPDRQNEQAFVFGGVSGSNPTGGAVPFVNGRLTLLQALARIGFGQSERLQCDLSDVHVIRSSGDRGELFVVDAAAIMDGDAANFELAPGDVIFVPPAAIASWNQALSLLLPSLQTIGGILNPFVQLKYLSQ
jgi:polysaccharide export outer membrane protein